MGMVGLSVTELQLERTGAYAVGRAKSLFQDVRLGNPIGEADVSTLLDVIATSTDYEVRMWTIHALTLEALRADNGTIVDGIAVAGAACLTMCLGADVRLPLGGSVLEALLRVTSDADDAIQQKLAQRLSSAIFVGTDITAARDRLVALLARPSSKKVDAAGSARACIFAAMTQDNAYRRKTDTDLKLDVDRADLERVAVQAFRTELERMATDEGLEADEARHALVAVAAAKERWTEVDAFTEYRRGSPGVLATVHGLLSASNDRAFSSYGRDHDTTRAFVAEVVRRVTLLRPALHKADLKRVDASLARQAHEVGLRLDTDPDARTLIAELLAAPLKKRDGLSRALIKEVRRDPTVGDLLPPLSQVPETGPRAQVADLHLLALRERGDTAGVAKHFAERTELGYSLISALSLLANSESVRIAPYVELVVPLLDAADPRVRWWASYFMRNVATKERVELAGWAPAILRRITDSARGAGQTVAVEGRCALRAALEVTARRGVFVTAAREQLAIADKKTRAALRAQLQELLPEALESPPKV